MTIEEIGQVLGLSKKEVEELSKHILLPPVMNLSTAARWLQLDRKTTARLLKNVPQLTSRLWSTERIQEYIRSHVYKKNINTEELAEDTLEKAINHTN